MKPEERPSFNHSPDQAAEPSPFSDNTWSVCPVCLDRIPAERIRVGDKVLMRKSCDKHGTHETVIWRGHYDFDNWKGNHDLPFAEPPGCPDNCGLCPDHSQKTCCVLLNVTDRCNLNCSFCLAGQSNSPEEPTLDDICRSISNLIIKDTTLLQLSGGEPTLRDDLPEIVFAAKQAGAKYVQLNTNGIRLASDPEFVRRLASAGLSFVFMQFDGTGDEIHTILRNQPLLEIKKKAIENCAAFNIGVTLVPTLVRGVNIHDIGGIIEFAVRRSPAVRGVHFQPASYFGRVPGLPAVDDRFTLDELVYEVFRQTNGKITPENLLPSCCDHPLCGFHGDFIVGSDNELVPLSSQNTRPATNCCDTSAADRNREFVARRWLRPDSGNSRGENNTGNLHDMDYFINRVKTHGFTITAMAFQDAGNIDFARLQQCSFHVYDRGRLVPFCAYYLNSWPASECTPAQ